MSNLVPASDHGEVARLDGVSHQVNSLAGRQTAGGKKRRPKPKPSAAGLTQPAQPDQSGQQPPGPPAEGGSVDVLA